MPDLEDGQTTEMQGSGSKPYILKNTGGVYSCSCPAWRNQSVAIQKRSCKHLRKLRGEAAEVARVGAALPGKPVKKTVTGTGAANDTPGPPLLLAESWDKLTDLSGWWMSEKLDGVRAYWDGKQFLSRLGNLYYAPDWFTKGLPDTALDGELWIDRKKFQPTVSIVRRQDKSDLWKQVRFLVFDAPAATGGFEERFEFLKQTIGTQNLPYASVHYHEACKDVTALKAELSRIESLGGEGLMLRQPGFEIRSRAIVLAIEGEKFRDADAIVIGHQPGAGRHKGRLGALLVRMEDGNEFAVGTGFSDKERETPPAIGTTITYKYQELSDGGVPRFPSYLRVKEELV